ncbi:MAG: hypothetical protein ABGW69_02170 [Nanoarchaeota archaeon]
MATVVEVTRPVTAGGRSMAKYVYGALKGQGVSDDIIKEIIKMLNKWAIKHDLEGKEITFDLELIKDNEDYTSINIKNVKIWEPVRTMDNVYSLSFDSQRNS